MRSQRQYLNILVGGWLLGSAFLWPHTQAQFTTAAAGGLLCTVVAALSGSQPRFRIINVGVGIWLLLSAFWLPHQSLATVANSVAAAIIVLVVAGWPRSRPGAPGNLVRVG